MAEKVAEEWAEDKVREGKVRRVSKAEMKMAKLSKKRDNKKRSKFQSKSKSKKKLKLVHKTIIC